MPPRTGNHQAQNGQRLNKKHAVVHTGTLDVKIMRLDGKQVTMSVFRQLDEESIFLSDGKLRGVPWGRVNYLFKGNRARTAFHVVWQDGDYLKRSPVPDYNRIDPANSSARYVWETLCTWFWDDFALKESFWDETVHDPRYLRPAGFTMTCNEYNHAIKILTPGGIALARKMQDNFVANTLAMRKLDQLFIAV